MSRMAKILKLPARRAGPADGRAAATDPTRERRARWLLILLAAGGTALFAWGAVMSARDETISIRKLADQARDSLYLRTLQEVETICRDPAAASGELLDHCVAQARFLIELPECHEACRRSAEVILPHAHR